MPAIDVALSFAPAAASERRFDIDIVCCATLLMSMLGSDGFLIRHQRDALMPRVMRDDI